MGSKYDFSGWATRNNVLCSDGRIINKDAFLKNDGQKVPLVWMHDHDNLENTLGHAILENREDGVYAYCSFNDTERAKIAKSLVQHGDINQLSIYANQLQQEGSNVMHGNIREVSLVMASANPEAWIEDVIQHGELVDDVAIIHSGEYIDGEEGEISTDSTEETDSSEDENVNETDSSEDENINETEGEEEMPDTISHADTSAENKTVEDVYNTLSQEQKDVVNFMVASAVQEAINGNLPKEITDELSDGSSAQGGEEMKHNVFEGDSSVDTLSHDAMVTIVGDAKRFGSLKESFLQHAAEYGIDQIEWLFPDHRQLNNTPEFIKNKPDGWVAKVMNGVHKSPFSRIKMRFADITADEARARGYTKGNRKVEEVITLLRRKVDPTTVYKKQKFDRDDVIDITDFDVISWIKAEMRMMLDEELARAFIFGDGRDAISPDKIDESKIIPVINDDELFVISHTVTPKEGQTFEEALVDASLIAKNDYQGSGNLIAFMRSTDVTAIRLLQDGFKHRLYKDNAEVSLAMGVNTIETVPPAFMPADVAAVIVDLSDYTVGADKGGAVNMFDDFDIDYNQEKYLIETRCSGTLTKPYSAIVLKKGEANPSQS